jgi:hypothetical protein
MSSLVEDVAIPDSKLALEITELVEIRKRRCCFITPAASTASGPWRVSVAA